MWSPWRSEYVASGAPNQDCIFCAFPNQAEDEQSMIAYRGERAYVIMNRFPYNSGHLLIVPFEHTADLRTLPGETVMEMMTLLTRCIGALEGAYGPDGYNAGMNLGSAAGAGIADHVHMHLVPRWTGDTNFMASLGDVKVMPERLQDSYRKLSEALRG